jgi:hypothetical protein
VIDQDLPHQAGRNRKKMSLIVQLRGLLVDEAQVRFVDQGCALQRVSRLLTLQAAMSDSPEFVVDKRQKSIKSGIFASPPPKQQLADGLVGV